MSDSAIHSTDMLSMAARFVNNTGRHIFLTGKAGTGKTTFLRDIVARTHKRCIICAPTGIAALNAKGVTIHSQFLLPLGQFVPDRELPAGIDSSSGPFTERTLATKHPLNQIRIRVLRSIDLLVIDEVSMLRADTLDAVDFRLRQARRNSQPFGGVQLLLIGDLYQLSPIVRDHERALYKNYYPSAFFFHSRALKRAGYVKIELNKIFRQENESFIRLLNHLRDNQLTREDIDTLNSRYTPAPPEDETIITLCTHNYQADNINQEAMKRLPGPEYVMKARVKNEFPESLYPLPMEMALKAGARVMFIKNDSKQGLYVNGNLGTLVAINPDLDLLVVKKDGGGEIAVGREQWENKRYTVNEVTKDTDEEIIGTFEQFPLRPAWAVTVHKSQGLTFERAILDLGKAFAPGQVYVALSRLTSPEGLILRTRITPDVVSTDTEVVEFTRAPQTPPAEALLPAMREYLEKALTDAFDFDPVLKQIQYVMGKKKDLVFEDDEMNRALAGLNDDIASEGKNTSTFRSHLRGYLANGENERLKERLSKAAGYYGEKWKGWILALLIHMADCAKFSGTKGYLDLLGELDVIMTNQREKVQRAEALGDAILNDREPMRQESADKERAEERKSLMVLAQSRSDERIIRASGKSGRVRKPKTPGEKKPKKEKGETYRTTYSMIDEGKGPEQVAVERGLTLGTILGHLARGIEEGRYTASAFFSPEDYSELRSAIENSPERDYTQILNATGGRFNQGHIRMVITEMRKTEA